MTLFDTPGLSTDCSVVSRPLRLVDTLKAAVDVSPNFIIIVAIAALEHLLICIHCKVAVVPHCQFTADWCGTGEKWRSRSDSNSQVRDSSFRNRATLGENSVHDWPFIYTP